MVQQESTMATKEVLIGEIKNILKIDLDFLSKLAPKDLVILAASLKGAVDREKKQSLRN